MKVSVSISYELAKARALEVLTERPLVASAVADRIWPEHGMKGQGAGGAASRVLMRMATEGLCRWESRRHSWGWVKGGG